jgi:trans-aconitate 2-methyltransferase
MNERARDSPSPAVPVEWDAEVYDRVGAPMTERGIECLDLLDLTGDETALDAGCGTGRVTAALLDLLPRGRVVAMDRSKQMLTEARRRLGSDPRVQLLEGDLDRLPSLVELDVVVSTSTLHWVGDHEAVFRRFAAALRPGGQLVAEYGGAGNIAAILSLLMDLGHKAHPWTFSSAEDAAIQLSRAGFDSVRARLVRRPVSIPRADLDAYLRTVVLRSYVANLASRDANKLVDHVAARLPNGTVDYVRLVVSARRS